MLAFAWDSISPSEGDPGGSPKPRKSSAVRVITDEDRMKGRNVMVATIALGRRCRNMMVRFDTPSARGLNIFEIAPAQELGPHQPDQRYPREQQKDPEQHKETGHQHRGNDQEKI